MQRYFQQSLEPIYQQWLTYVQQPGVRCVDETTYCIDGIKYWLWVATSDQVCVLLLAPTRSSAELKQLLGEDFKGILSSDCFSAYNPQSYQIRVPYPLYLQFPLEGKPRNTQEPDTQANRHQGRHGAGIRYALTSALALCACQKIGQLGYKIRK
ncbi:MAG: hypothetical protein NVSMB70_06590 [Chamaesiphon sp.]